MLQFAQWQLRAFGQVVLQNNPWTGGLILLGVGLSSPLAAAEFLFGACIATGVALAMRADRGLLEAGLFGFAGGWSGLLVGGFAFPEPAYPTWDLLWFLLMGGVLAVPLFSACYVACKKLDTSATALPVVILFWVLLAGLQYSETPVDAPLPQLFSEQGQPWVPYSLGTFVGGITYGLAGLFKQESAWTGVLILVGIGVNSRISLGMAIASGLLSVLTSWFFGHPEAVVRSGLLTFNAMLSAIALGGFFFYLDAWSAVWALVGALLSMWFFVVLSVMLRPTGMPVGTLPLVLVVWIMTLGAGALEFARRVPLSEISRPEDHLLQARG